jgi:hypothetical protein
MPTLWRFSGRELLPRDVARREEARALFRERLLDLEGQLEWIVCDLLPFRPLQILSPGCVAVFHPFAKH